MGDSQTNKHTHTHTDRANHSIVAHFVMGNYKNRGNYKNKMFFLRKKITVDSVGFVGLQHVLALLFFD